ncbi:Putative protein similar to VEG136 protein of Neurospora crassa [Podospora comata]|uniref:Cytoplasmic tRNA 2-thiolation protein 1 n=1 Tax=Podospora comata TaxID=48703 RepID=A0ABY6S9K9_PODCO|nr:Putative protein similar to VEG136 protein of Neurospora crassa [Podospora comata]
MCHLQDRKGIHQATQEPRKALPRVLHQSLRGRNPPHHHIIQNILPRRESCHWSLRWQGFDSLGLRSQDTQRTTWIRTRSCLTEHRRGHHRLPRRLPPNKLYDWTMDEVVQTIGKKGNCTYCGVFRRQALDRGAKMLGIKHVVTGHNADDVAETVMMNLLRADLSRLSRSTSIVTGDNRSEVKRSKPLKYAYEKEIVLYAFHKKLEYFSTECIYSPEAFRGSARGLIKQLEKVRPSAILDIVRSGEDMARLVPGESPSSCGCKGQKAQAPVAAAVEEGIGGCGSTNSRTPGGEMAALDKQLRENEEYAELEVDVTKTIPKPKQGEKETQKELPIRTASAPSKGGRQVLGQCKRCGYMSSQEICQACTLLEGLNKNRPQIQI